MISTAWIKSKLRKKLATEDVYKYAKEIKVDPEILLGIMEDKINVKNLSLQDLVKISVALGWLEEKHRENYREGLTQ